MEKSKLLAPQMSAVECEVMFHTAMCNGLDYIMNHGIELTFDDADYKAAKTALREKNPNQGICYEDVLMEILHQGGKLTMMDHEDEENTKSIDLPTLVANMQWLPKKIYAAYLTEEDDAEDADGVLQTAFFANIIFG